MRILLVNKYFYHKGGAETYFFALAEGLKALGHEVAFFSMEHPDNLPSEWSRHFVSQKEYNGKLSAGQQLRGAATLIYSGESKRKFEALLEEFRPDIIHMNNVHRQITLSILDAPYLKRHRVPVVYTAHDYILLCPAYTMVDGHGQVCDRCLDGRFRHAVENGCVKGSKAKSALAMLEADFLRWYGSYGKIDRIIAPSAFMGAKLAEGGYADRVTVMQNFLTSGQMAMAAKVTDTGKFDEAAGFPYFLFFGRLSREKGILTLVRAFLEAAGLADGDDPADAAGMAGRLPADWQLRIVGDGPERGAIEELIRGAGPEAISRIQLLGYKTGEALQRQVGGARFSVLSSEWRENMPYSGLESLAAQTPVIGARIGGIPELVEEGRTGFGFASGDADDLACVMLRAAAVGRGDYAAMQSACAAYVEERCGQDSYIRGLVDLYRGLVEKREAK